MRFFIVDAFTEQVFGGNPAGVVLIPQGEGFPQDEVMRKTAAELRYSETAFIQTLAPDEFRVRYFTPTAEVDLCGHATIGSFSALAQAGIIRTGDVVMNHTLAGDLKIEAGDGFVMMEMAQPRQTDAMEDPAAIQELYDIMGAPQEAGKIDMIPRMISTGLPDIIMPLSDRAALNGMEPDMNALSALSERYGVTGVHAFTLDAPEGITACARNFAPLFGIDEEAATGTASGAMTYYLYMNGILSEDARCTYLQGEAMDRPSKILAELTAMDAGCRIRVGGSAVILAEGDIRI